MLRNLANATSGEVDIIDIGDDDDDGDDKDERMFIKSNTSSRSMKKLLSDVAVVVIFKTRSTRSMRCGLGGRITSFVPYIPFDACGAPVHLPVSCFVIATLIRSSGSASSAVIVTEYVR
jgi:hypothetical protein